jgi:hypothetical protein
MHASGAAKQRHWNRGGPAREGARDNRPNAAPNGIDSVAFLRRNAGKGANPAHGHGVARAMKGR